MQMTFANLDKLLKGGCAHEGCGHKHDELFLHGKCHIGGRIEVAVRTNEEEGPYVEVRCMECSSTILKLTPTD